MPIHYFNTGRGGFSLNKGRVFNTPTVLFAPKNRWEGTKKRSQNTNEKPCTRAGEFPLLLMRGLCINRFVKKKIFHLSLHCCACARASLPTFRPAGAVSQPLPRPSPSYDRLPSPSVSLTDPASACVNYYYVLRDAIRRVR